MTSMLRKYLVALTAPLILCAGCAKGSAGDPDADLSSPDAGDGTSDSGAADAPTAADAVPAGTPDLTMPNGGEVWAQGSVQTVQWSYGSDIASVDIELWYGDVKQQDIALGEPCDGGYEWTVPAGLPSGQLYRVRIINSDVPTKWDESEEPFTLHDGALTVTSPNGGEALLAGDSIDITWTSSGSVSWVDIELHENGSEIAVLAESQFNSGSFNWAIPTDAAAGSNYTIVVRDADYPVVSDESNASFSLANWQYRAAVSITSPSARTSFPVLVELDTGNFAYAHARSDGGDLRFASTVDRSTGFDLPHYVAEWNGAGTSRIWVLVPSLPSGIMETVYLFYGNPSATTTSDLDAALPTLVSSTNGMVLAAAYDVDRFQIEAGHTVYLTSGTPTAVTARIIEIHGTVEGSGRGYDGGGTGGGTGPGAGGGSGDSGAGGAGHGGTGGIGGYDSGDTPGTGGSAYGSTTAESIDMGSGGGGPSDVDGGPGGGAITLRAHEVIVSGTIQTDGANGVYGSVTGRGSGGGAGGGVLIVGHRVQATGVLRARGGDGGTDTSTASDGGGGGGGGRVKILYAGALTNSATIDMAGGLGGDFGDVASGQDGTAGTSYINTAASGEPTVTVGSEQAIY